MIGEQVSHYRILGSLGSGGMGEVYRAEDVRLGRQVALKFLKPEYLNEAKARQRFEFEARAAAILNHPNITTLYEFNADQGFISLEFVDGRTLEDVLGEDPHPALETVRVALAICRGLGHAHGRNVIHRDIKPSNVLMGNDGTIKLTDFGLAKVRDTSVQATLDVVQGTPAYMAPEQISGQGTDRRGDLFALGVVIYRALAGRIPWPGEGVVAILFSVLQHDPEPLTSTVPGIPPQLAVLVQSLMQKEPDDRLSSAEEVEAQLLEIEAQLCSETAHGAAGAAAAMPGIARPRPGAPAFVPAGAERAVKPWEVSTTFEQIAEVPGLKLPLIGRDDEFRLLTESMDLAIQGQGRTILISGEAGVGKSRLMRELEMLARSRKVLTLKGQCTFNGGRNFEPFVDALETFARGADQWGARYLAELTTEHESLGALLPTLKVLLDAGPAGGVEPRTREQLWYILDAMLKSIAGDVPVILFIDELHNADEGTLALLTHVTRNLGSSRLLIVATCRTEELVDISGRENPLVDVIRTLSGVGTFQRIEIKPVDETATGQFLEAAFPESPIDPGLVGSIHSRAQGNPFFTTEILNLLWATHDSTRPLSRRALESGAQVMPATVAEVVKRRLMRLSQDERDVLEVAAVEGETFHTDVVGEATGLPRLQLLKRLRSLHVTHHLIEPSGQGHRFAQGLIREVLLRDIPEELKVEYHSVIASYLLHGYAERADYAGTIGYQLLHGHRFAEALPYLIKAGDEARRLFLNDRALDYYEQALQALPEAGQVTMMIGDAGETTVTRAGLLRARASTLLLLGRLEAARGVAEEALAEDRSRADDRGAADSLALIGQAALAQGDHATAQESLDTAFERYSALGDLVQVARCEESLGSLATRVGNYQLALSRLAAARATLEAEGNELRLAQVQLEVGRVRALMGEYGTALEDYEEAIARFSRLGDRYSLERGLLLKGSALFQRRQMEQAVASFEEGLGIATAIGDLQGMAFFQANLGNIHLVRGDCDSAHKAYSSALARFREIGDQRAASQILVALGNVCYTRGDLAEAAEWYESSIAPRRAMGDRWALANSLDNLGAVEYYLGHWNSGLEHAREALRLRMDLGGKPGQAESALNLGNLLAMVGDPEGAERSYNDALRLARELGDKQKIARACLSRACLALWRGDAEAARSIVQEVRALHLGDPAIQSRRLVLESLAGVADQQAEPRLLQQGVDQADRSRSIPERVTARLALSRRCRAEGKTADARVLIDAAMELVGTDRIPALEFAGLKERRALDGEVGFSTTADEDRISRLEERLAAEADSAQAPPGGTALAPVGTAGGWRFFPLP